MNHGVLLRCGSSVYWIPQPHQSHRPHIPPPRLPFASRISSSSESHHHHPYTIWIVYTEKDKPTKSKMYTSTTSTDTLENEFTNIICKMLQDDGIAIYTKILCIHMCLVSRTSAQTATAEPYKTHINGAYMRIICLHLYAKSTIFGKMPFRFSTILDHWDLQFTIFKCFAGAINS